MSHDYTAERDAVCSGLPPLQEDAIIGRPLADDFASSVVGASRARTREKCLALECTESVEHTPLVHHVAHRCNANAHRKYLVPI